MTICSELTINTYQSLFLKAMELKIVDGSLTLYTFANFAYVKHKNIHYPRYSIFKKLAALPTFIEAVKRGKFQEVYLYLKDE